MFPVNYKEISSLHEEGLKKKNIITATYTCKY